MIVSNKFIVWLFQYTVWNNYLNHYNVMKESPAVTLLMNINALLYLAGTEIIAVVMLHQQF